MIGPKSHESEIVSEILLKMVCGISGTWCYRPGTKGDRDTLRIFIPDYITISSL